MGWLRTVERFVIRGAIVGLLVLIALWWVRLPVPHATPPAPTRILLVWDTVRASSTSLCDYERPTTPFLEELAARRGAVHSCRAFAPSTWTLPSHASFFTGRRVDEHLSGAGPGELEFAWGNAVPLDDRLPTLAERMRAQGYQTVLVSANPILGPHTGLSRGFDAIRVARLTRLWGMGPVLPDRFFRDADLVDRVRDALLWDVEPDRPLFLVVNLFDAHDPWAPVPEGLGWVPARPAFAEFESALRHQRAGTLDSPEAAGYPAHIRDLYDHGIAIADRSTRSILEVLEGAGWLDGGYRLVVTSDHGEYLGEHGRLVHGGPYFYDEVSRVPFVYLDTDGPPPALPEVISATALHDLLLHGTPPADSEVLGATWGHDDRPPEPADRDGFCWFGSVARFTVDRTTMCVLDELQSWDRPSDPAQERPGPAHPEDAARLEPLGRTMDAYWSDREGGGEELEALLRSLGYVD